MRCTATFDFAAAPLLERLIVRVRATRATAAPAARVGGIAEGHGPCAQAAASKDAGSAREKVRVQSGSVASSVVFGARLSRQGRRAPPQVAGQTFSSIKLLPCWVCPLRDNSRQHAFGCVDPQRGRSNSPAARRNEEVTLRYPCCLPPRLLAAVAPRCCDRRRLPGRAPTNRGRLSQSPSGQVLWSLRLFLMATWKSGLGNFSGTNLSHVTMGGNLLH